MKRIHQYLTDNVDILPRISKKTGIDVGLLNSFKSEGKLPSYNELRVLGKYFNTSISDLISESEHLEKYDFLYRKSADEKITTNISDKFHSYIKNVTQLGYSSSFVEPINNKLKQQSNTIDNAELLAQQFRYYFLDDDQFSPMMDLPCLLSEKLGYFVKVLELGKNIDGASAVVDGVVFLFISPRFEGRMLFTLAHELGHIINHHDHSGDFFYIDKKISFNSRKSKSELEIFANAFSSALLIPRIGIVEFIKKFRSVQNTDANAPISDIEIIYIANIYGVSFDVAAFRLELLGLLPQGGGFSLSERIKKDFGSPEKRARSLGLPEREGINFSVLPPKLISTVLDLVRNGEYSVEKIAELLEIPIAELIRLNGLHIEEH